MDATADADFEKEVKFLHSVRHKNIVSFLGAGNQPGAGPFFVVEYCTRGSLQGIIKDQLLRLTMSDIISMALDAAQGMNFLHSCEPTASGGAQPTSVQHLLGCSFVWNCSLGAIDEEGSFRGHTTNENPSRNHQRNSTSLRLRFDLQITHGELLASRS
eukprot:m.286821 g.286821  ORF g.286821 m.286821 type:complete len:158 (+) comp55002_c0_seq5:255-728(+)